MTTFDINPDEIAATLRKRLEGYTPSIAANQVGHVVEVGDGIARVGGLPETSVNELLEFEGGKMGIALNLDEDSLEDAKPLLQDLLCHCATPAATLGLHATSPVLDVVRGFAPVRYESCLYGVTFGAFPDLARLPVQPEAALL